VLWRVDAPGGWTFVTVPPEHAPEVVGGWGRSPVRATVNGRSWDTSTWRDARHGTLLPVPARIRGSSGPGDEVQVTLAVRAT
jgi:hypothetical protein